jgi:hypothetical protein
LPYAAVQAVLHHQPARPRPAHNPRSDGKRPISDQSFGAASFVAERQNPISKWLLQ